MTITPDYNFLYIIVLIVLALIFTFTNGFQDGSVVAASAIASRSISPVHVIVLVAVCELAGAIFGGNQVANSIKAITSHGQDCWLAFALISGLLAAISWNFLARYLKLPTSSTHALVGGVIGGIVGISNSSAYIVWGDFNSITNSTGVVRVFLSLFISPLFGVIGGYVIFGLLVFILQRATSKISTGIKHCHWLTLSVLAFSHGANDTQKAVGLISMGLFSLGFVEHGPYPFWTHLITGLAMFVGILSFVPGIVRKVGDGIFKLRPLHSLSAQLSSAAIILTASLTGGPVGTSQVIASSIVGVGTASRMKGVQWEIFRGICIAWLITIPFTCLLSYLIFTALSYIFNNHPANIS